jgi:hypothetical protein
MTVIRNPVLWITCALPLVTVLASFFTLGAAVRHPDNELPEQYHWEGFRLDRDFARADQAAALGVRAVFDGVGVSGECRARLELEGEPPDSISLTLTHATQPSLDQHITFRRMGRSGARYVAQCSAAPESHWRAELTAGETGWSIRQNIPGSLAHAVLEAARPAGR